VNEFVDECRREWKRLGVPDPVANEMAADLAADLEEAAAEGVSAEEVLGSGAFDPRAFAGAWAAERGVIGTTPAADVPAPPPTVRRRLPASTIVFALVALIGVLMAAFGPSRGGPVAVPVFRSEMRVKPIPPEFFGPGKVLVPGSRVIGFAGHSGIDTHALGLLLLIVGLLGIAASTTLTTRFRHRPWWPRHPTVTA
jgi:hypothetical protein